MTVSTGDVSKVSRLVFGSISILVGLASVGMVPFWMRDSNEK